MKAVVWNQIYLPGMVKNAARRGKETGCAKPKNGRRSSPGAISLKFSRRRRPMAGSAAAAPTVTSISEEPASEYKAYRYGLCKDRFVVMAGLNTGGGRSWPNNVRYIVYEPSPSNSARWSAGFFSPAPKAVRGALAEENLKSILRW